MNQVKTIVLLAVSAGVSMAAQVAFAAKDGIPAFDVRSSCNAAKTFNAMEDQNKTFDGCLQDEDRAKSLLRKNWLHFKIKDRTDCTTEVTRVAPSYVEILTCLEMSDETGALLSRDVNQPAGQAMPSTPSVKSRDPLANEPLKSH